MGPCVACYEDESDPNDTTVSQLMRHHGMRRLARPGSSSGNLVCDRSLCRRPAVLPACFSTQYSKLASFPDMSWRMMSIKLSQRPTSVDLQC